MKSIRAVNQLCRLASTLAARNQACSYSSAPSTASSSSSSVFARAAPTLFPQKAKLSQSRFLATNVAGSQPPQPTSKPASEATLRDPNEVIRDCKAVLSHNASDLGALVTMGQAMYRLGQWEDSLKAAEKALEVDGKNPQALLLKADVLYRQGKEDKALAAVTEACDKLPNNADVFRLRGILLATKGDLSEALTHLNTAARLGPKVPETHYERGRVLLQLKDEHAALAAFSKAINLNAKYMEALNMKAVAQSNLKEFDEALATWDQALQVEPDNSTILANKGKLLLRIKRYAKAIEAFDEAIRLEGQQGGPIEVPLHLAQAECLIHLDRWEDAIAGLKKIIEGSPKDATAHALMGQAYNHIGHLADGLKALEKACELTPFPQPAWLYTRGSILHRMGKDKEAIALLEKSIKDHMGSNIIANMYALLGQVYLRGVGDIEKARAALNTAIEKDPDEFDAYVTLAVLCDQTGDHQGALKNWDKAVSLNDQDANTHTNRGKCLSHLKKFSEAIEAFDAAIKVKPTDSEPHKAKGVCYWMQNDPDKAFQSWSTGAEQAEPDVYIFYLMAVYLHTAKQDNKRALDYINRAQKVGQDQGAVPVEILEFRDQIVQALNIRR